MSMLYAELDRHPVSISINLADGKAQNIHNGDIHYVPKVIWQMSFTICSIQIMNFSRKLMVKKIDVANICQYKFPVNLVNIH